MAERSGNVAENKGLLWKTCGEAGMSLKTQVLGPLKAGMLLKGKSVRR
jgi:hypothetical protein